MDLQKMKEKALELKEKAQQASQRAVDYSAAKIANSSLTLRSIKDIQEFQKMSRNGVGKDAKSGEKKEFVHRCVLIFVDVKSDFFETLLYKIPILQTKAFSQSLKLRLADKDIPNLHLADYQVSDVPSLVVFENEKIHKVISGEENIQKVVKSFSLDINKTIDEL